MDADSEKGQNPQNLSDDDVLKNIYYDLENPASFSTADKLYEAADRKIARTKIHDWLASQLTYTIHKPRRTNFKRNRYLVDNINTQWQADLIDLASISSENDGYKYILLVIDSFSRFLRVRPLRTKSGKDVQAAFKEIVIESGITPRQLVTDRGMYA
jgi:hypothetical protein